MLDQIQKARLHVEQLRALLILDRDGVRLCEETPAQRAERLVHLADRIEAQLRTALAGMDIARANATLAAENAAQLLARLGGPHPVGTGDKPAEHVVGLVSVESRIYGLKHPGRPNGSAENGAARADGPHGPAKPHQPSPKDPKAG